MWKHLTILCVLLGVAELYHLDITPFHQELTDYLTTWRIPLLTYSSLLAIVLIIATLLARAPLMLGIVRLINNIMLEAGLFIIIFISLSSIYWAVVKNGNLWRDFQPALPIPAIFLLTAVLCTNIIDFNQPIIRDLVPYLLIAAASFLIISMGII